MENDRIAKLYVRISRAVHSNARYDLDNDRLVLSGEFDYRRTVHMVSDFLTDPRYPVFTCRGTLEKFITEDVPAIEAFGSEIKTQQGQMGPSWSKSRWHIEALHEAGFSGIVTKEKRENIEVREHTHLVDSVDKYELPLQSLIEYATKVSNLNRLQAGDAIVLVGVREESSPPSRNSSLDGIQMVSEDRHIAATYEFAVDTDGNIVSK